MYSKRFMIPRDQQQTCVWSLRCNLNNNIFDVAVINLNRLQVFTSKSFDLIILIPDLVDN